MMIMMSFENHHPSATTTNGGGPSQQIPSSTNGLYNNGSPIPTRASFAPGSPLRPVNNSSLPTTPKFVRKFNSISRPLDLRKLTLYGNGSSSISNGAAAGAVAGVTTNGHGPGPQGSYHPPLSQMGSVPITNPDHYYYDSNSPSSTSNSPSPSASSLQTSNSSSQDSSPRTRYFGSARSHDSFILKRQSSQTRLRESLLASLLLSPRTKEIEFTVPQTLSPLTPTFSRKGLAAGNSGESSPAGSLSGSRSETDPSTSRANTPSPIFFRGSGSDIAGACSSASSLFHGLNPELYKTKPKSNGENGEESDSEDSEDETEDDRLRRNGLNSFDQNYYGHVKFALEYDTTNEKLLVTRIKARNLVSKSTSPSSSAKYYYYSTSNDDDDSSTTTTTASCATTSDSASTGSTTPTSPSCNPFVRVSLSPDDRRTLQSKPKKGTRNPHFHEVFGFQISRSGLDERSLKLCFYDVDQNKKHVMMGYIIQPLKDIDWAFGKQVFKQDLLRDIGELSPNIGEVLVSLCYNGNISRLTVTVFEARGIKTSESASGLYAKISFSQHTKVIKTKKTSTVTLLGCRSSFNESFNFKVPAEMLDTASVSIQLMYAQPGYNKDLTAGRIVLGSFMFARGKGLDHWTEMLSKQKEQIQYWHAVSE